MLRAWPINCTRTENEAGLNLRDPLAKVYYLRLCNTLARHPTLPAERRDYFLRRLMERVHPDSSDAASGPPSSTREFLEATQLLVRVQLIVHARNNM